LICFLICFADLSLARSTRGASRFGRAPLSSRGQREPLAHQEQVRVGADPAAVERVDPLDPGCDLPRRCIRTEPPRAYRPQRVTRGDHHALLGASNGAVGWLSIRDGRRERQDHRTQRQRYHGRVCVSF
jgi:hypothetical protein